MANVYVRSGAGGAATGADWANAYLTLAAAFTAKAAGDVFWVSEDHAETQATAMTNTSPGTLANPCFVYCVNHGGSVPPVEADLRTTATITTTGNNAIANVGSAIYYGIIFNCGSGAVSPSFNIAGTTVSFVRYDNCALNLVATGNGNTILTNGSAFIDLVATPIAFSAVNQSVQLGSGARLRWSDTASAIAGSAVPTNLVVVSGAGARTFFEGVDLSAAGSGKTLIAGSTTGGEYWLKDCKLGASVTVGAPLAPQSMVHVMRCDSGATNYRTEEYQYMGTQTMETTIVRAGGASDGTTSVAWKIVTTANSKWVLPFVALPMAIWNNATPGTPINVDVYGIWGGGAVPNADDIWIEVEYLGASGTPLGSRATSGKADNLGASVAITSDASVWGGSTTAFRMRASFTPQQRGALSVYVKAAKASSTFYVDPRPVLS